MAALQLRRGAKSLLPAKAAVGEPLVATDTRELYIGMGTGAGDPGVIKLGDVVFGSTAPAVEKEKLWIDTTANTIYRASDDGASWVAVTSSGGGGVTINTAADLGGLTPSDIVISSQKAIKAYVDTKAPAINTSIDMGGATPLDTLISSQKAIKTYVDTVVGNASGSPTINTATDLGGATPSDIIISSQKAIKAYVDTALTNVKVPSEWPDSVISELTTPPGSPITGDRYLVKATATDAWVGLENQIVQYNGTSWIATVPTTGTFLNIDADTSGLYYFGGVSWVKKSFELNTAGVGIDITAGVVKIKDTIVAADGSGGLVWDAVNGVLSVGIIDGGGF